MGYRFVEHTGDTAVEITAAGERELFEEAANALADILIDRERGAGVADRLRLPLDLEAEDGESLLIDFLNELIFRFDSEGFLCARIEFEELSIERPARLRGELLGETFDPSRHVSLTEVKAATFHNVEIERGAGALRTTLVFDL